MRPDAARGARAVCALLAQNLSICCDPVLLGQLYLAHERFVAAPQTLSSRATIAVCWNDDDWWPAAVLSVEEGERSGGDARAARRRRGGVRRRLARVPPWPPSGEDVGGMFALFESGEVVDSDDDADDDGGAFDA